jgi:pimeloyl-ACP methyl ester carboxylesterase
MRGEFVDVGGTRVYYYAAGTRGAGEPVVFLHGFPMSSRLWHAVVRDFPAGHRLVLCDLPGFGRSEPSREPGPRSCARTILGLLDDLRIPRACLVGHGLGGAVAQAIAVAAPERISHLALIDSAAFGAAPRRMARLARTLLPLARRVHGGFLAGLVQGSLLHGFRDPERSRLTLDTCLRPFTTATGREVLSRHLESLGHDDTTELTSEFAALGIPTAILWGGRDPFYPVSLGERLREAIAGATLDVVPDASHFVPADAPERVIAFVGALLVRRSTVAGGR